MAPKEDFSSGVLLDSIPSPEESSPPAVVKQHRTQLSDVAMAKSVAAVAQQRTRTDEELWWIHGNGYDLKDFVKRHPGGKEAIMLGKGRDCTALVESYHAFSSQHGRILEKYLYKAAPKAQKPETDFFYDILKQRAAATLKEKGIDPVQDRGAGFWRSLYYLVIVLAVLATGYFHMKVSPRLCNVKALLAIDISG